MTDIVERLRGGVTKWGGVDCAPDAILAAADEIEQLRGTLRRALRLYEIEQAERPTANEPIWVKLARQLLERER